jgi:hypothetical protein
LAKNGVDFVVDSCGGHELYQQLKVDVVNSKNSLYRCLSDLDVGLNTYK